MTTYSAVVTTGIYCRPGCGAKPLAENVRTFELAAAAEAAGFRACMRCRPYRVAGPVASDAPELVCRAVQLIITGALDDGSEVELGRRLGVSSRHLRRMFHDHLGVTPDQLARSRRAHFARRLLDDSDMPIADVAFASGFGSLRQFNRAIQEVFRASPHELRRRRRRSDRIVTDGGLRMRLPFQRPYDWQATLAFLADRAVPGVESVDDGVYRRTISLDNGPGVIEVGLGGEDHLLVVAHLPYWEGLIHVVDRVGAMFGTDADPAAAIADLFSDPVIGPLVRARPGVRVPGSWGPLEIAVHAIVSQRRSPTRTRDLVGNLVRKHGQPVPGLTHALTHLFPSAEVLANANLSATCLPTTVAPVVRSLASAVASNEIVLDGTSQHAELVDSLTAIEGLGMDAAQHIALRLRHRDAFPATDPVLRRSLNELDVADVEHPDVHWRPWRALAATHLLTRSR